MGLDVDGTAVTRSRLLPLGPDLLDPEVVDADDVPTVPLSTAAGDIDGDGLLDVVVLQDFGMVDQGTQYRLLVILGATHRGERLVALSAPAAADSPRIHLADFDGDGVDEMLLSTPVGFAILGTGGDS